MVEIRFLCVIIAVAGWSPTLAEGEAPAQMAETSLVRVPRTIKKKLCFKFGLCGGGFGGYQQGFGGHGGYQGGYGNPGYTPINIAISQSQSSANEGGGGYGSGYYPNNYQYNGGYPIHGFNGYNNFNNHGYSRFPNQIYGGYRPGFNNGDFSNNNQFNGNFYAGDSDGGYDYQGNYGYQGNYDYQGNYGYPDNYGYQGNFGYQGNDDRYDYDEGERSASDANARSGSVASAEN